MKRRFQNRKAWEVGLPWEGLNSREAVEGKVNWGQGRTDRCGDGQMRKGRWPRRSALGTMILNDRMGGWQFLLALLFICFFLVPEEALGSISGGFRPLQALAPHLICAWEAAVIRALQDSPALEKLSRIFKNWPESRRVWVGTFQDQVYFPGSEGLQFPRETLGKRKGNFWFPPQSKSQRKQKGMGSRTQVEGFNVERRKAASPLEREVKKARFLSFDSQGSICWNLPILSNKILFLLKLFV